jgi:hypothetical protein
MASPGAHPTHEKRKHEGTKPPEYVSGSSAPSGSQTTTFEERRLFGLDTVFDAAAVGNATGEIANQGREAHRPAAILQGTTQDHVIVAAVAGHRDRLSLATFRTHGLKDDEGEGFFSAIVVSL